MISDTTQVDALLVDLIAREDNSHHHVLDVADKASADCEVRRQLRQYAARYTQAVTSRVLQVDRRKSTPHIDWQHVDIHNSLTRKRFSQPGYDVVLLSTPPEQPELWLELLKPGGWLLCGEHQQWQRWQAPDEEQATLPFALTDIQHAYWIGRSQSLALGGVSCHVYFEWRIVDFDIVVFEAAWNRVIARHGMMRACVDDNGQQRILQRVPYYTITHDDMRGLSRQQRAEQLAYTRQRMCHQVLDASHWPLFELRISQEDDHHSRVHLDLDLLTFDVQSFHIVLSELERFYHQPQLNLPEIRYSFRDYQLAQMQTRSSQAWRDDRAWWLARLENLWPAPQLPLACQPADVERPTFRRLQRRIEPARWQQLSQQASQQGITPSAMLLAVFSELLALWCEEAQFTLNLTHFNRRPYHPEVAQLVGDFTSVLLLSIDCQEPLSFRDRALAIQHMLWERLAHSQFGGVDVLRELAKRQGKADSSAMPIVFTSLLGMDLDTLIEGADLLGEPEFLYTATPQVWLDHQVMVRKGSLEYNWIVIDELFPAGMSDALFTQYGELLDRLTDDHQCWLHPLDVPLTREQHQIRTAANNTDVALPLMPLHGAFFDQVQQQPDAIALIADGEQWDYRQLAQQALRVAARLNQLHCSGKPVIVSLPKSAGQIIATLGVMASGAILVPVDSDWPLARLHEVIVQSGAVALIAAQACLVSCPMINGVTLHELPDEPASVQLPDLNQVAYIIYTSGSTGKPKGVAMQHAATANTLSDVSGRLQLAPSDRVFGISALSFDLAIFDVFATLGAGASLVLPQQQGMRDAAHWWQLLQQHRITCWNSVPSLLAMLLEYGKNEGETLPCLRAIMLSGDWIGKDLVSAIPKLAPAARIIAMGGATEAAIWSNWFDVDPHQVSGHTVPYGYPLANQRYYVLDTQGRDRPAGVAGDLFIAGSGLAIGYWRDSKRTDAAFIHHPRSGERLYRTGDLARYDQQGCIEFLGRRDTQVKIGGYRIELGEIETAILAQQGVQAAVADVVTTNSGGQQLAAWVVLQTRCSDTTPLRHAGRLAADQLPDTTRLASLCAFQAESEALAPLMMLQILQQLEFCQPQGWEIGTRLTALHIAPRFNRLLTHWHESLEKEGWLAQDKGGWRMDLSTPTTLALAQRLDDGKHRLRQFLSWLNDGERFADWLFASADAIGSVLREPQLASSLLFPEGDSKASEALYQGNIIADYLGNIAAQLLKTALSGSDASRVLEIGAGIGGLTASTLPVFAQLTVQGEYFHTDVSPWFTHYAEDRFGEYTQLRTGRYDINQRAIQQDYAAQTFEAILAANVLHNAHQLAQTLSDIWLMLKPGGCLILLEATQDKQLQWVTAAAVLEHAAEGGNPQGDSPLLSEAAWRRALTLAGFELIESWPQAGTPMAFTGQHIFLARRPETVATPQQLQQGIAARLPAYMLPEHLMALAALPLSANGKIDRKQLPPPLLMSRHQTQCFSPPQTLTEQRLAIIWCELLQVKQVGREEDFFMAGGDSLLATRLVTCINSEWKIRVPIRLVFTHTQLQAMANALDASTQPTLTLPLVELSDDCCDKLLCFHASDGFALAYQQLATALTPGLQTLGVQACGLLPGEVPISSLEEQVQKVLKALPQPSISGRLHLTGWSMGVYLAMEAAYQLQRQGVQIASLILIDPAPQKAMAGCAASEYALWSSMADSTLRRHITSFSMMDEKEKLSNWRRVLPVGLTLEDPELSRLIAVIRANVQAMVTAPQRSLDIPLHIISASERDAEWGTAREALEGWFTRPPRQYCIEGSNHLNIITQPALFSVMQRITQG